MNYAHKSDRHVPVDKLAPQGTLTAYWLWNYCYRYACFGYHVNSVSKCINYKMVQIVQNHPDCYYSQIFLFGSDLTMGVEEGHTYIIYIMFPLGVAMDRFWVCYQLCNNLSASSTYHHLSDLILLTYAKLCMVFFLGTLICCTLFCVP